MVTENDVMLKYCQSIYQIQKLLIQHKKANKNILGICSKALQSYCNGKNSNNSMKKK